MSRTKPTCPSDGALLLGRLADLDNGRLTLDLVPDRKDPTRFHAVIDSSGGRTRRSRSGLSLSIPDKLQLPVRVKLGPDGRSHLYLTDSKNLADARRLLGRQFDFSRELRPLSLLVLAIADHDTRSWDERQVLFRDGNQLNCALNNVIPPATENGLAKQLDALTPLADVPAETSPEAHLPQARKLLRALLRRYQYLQLNVTAKKIDNKHFPVYEATVSLEGIAKAKQAPWPSRVEARGAGGNPFEAIFSAEFEALRRLLFLDHEVAYCGTLIPTILVPYVEASLQPIDVSSGTYLLVVRFKRDRLPSHIPGEWLSNDDYEINIVLDAPKEESRTRYLKVFGSVPRDIARAFSNFLDFEKGPIRLHRLVLALAGRDLRDPASDYQVLEDLGLTREFRPRHRQYKRALDKILMPRRPGQCRAPSRCLLDGLTRPHQLGLHKLPPLKLRRLPDERAAESYHVHHRWHHGLDNRLTILQLFTSVFHQLGHTDWQEKRKGERKFAPIPELEITFTRTIRTMGWYDCTLENLHRASLLAFDPQPPMKGSRLQRHLFERLESTRLRELSSRRDGQKTVASIMEKLRQAGGSMYLTDLICSTSLHRTNLQEWLDRLEKVRMIERRKDGRSMIISSQACFSNRVPIPRRRPDRRSTDRASLHTPKE